MSAFNFEGVDPREGEFSKEVQRYAHSKISTQALPEEDSWQRKTDEASKRRTKRNLGRNAIGQRVETQEVKGER